jgi:hypothetical protein
LPVLRVELPAPPRVMPDQVETALATGTVLVPRDKWSASTSFGFRNGYATQYPTQVVLSAVVSMPRPLAAMRLQFAGLTVRKDRTYRIAVGDEVKDIAGAQLAKSQEAIFHGAPASAAIPVTIRLADPAFPAEDIGVNFVSAELSEFKQ